MSRIVYGKDVEQEFTDKATAVWIERRFKKTGEVVDPLTLFGKPYALQDVHGEGLDHAMLVTGYCCWGPSAEADADSKLGNNEMAIISAPYEHATPGGYISHHNQTLLDMDFDPAQLRIEPMEFKWYHENTGPVVITLRDVQPGSKEWEWFIRVVGQYIGVGNLPYILPTKSPMGILVRQHDSSAHMSLVNMGEQE